MPQSSINGTIIWIPQQQFCVLHVQAVAATHGGLKDALLLNCTWLAPVIQITLPAKAFGLCLPRNSNPMSACALLKANMAATAAAVRAKITADEDARALKLQPVDTQKTALDIEPKTWNLCLSLG